MSENRKLTGKVAIVFGGSRGIGAAAARRLAREGANVSLTYVSAPDKAADTVRAIEGEGRTGLAIKADSADPTAIRDAVTQAVAQLGRLDIVVVNAGILRRGDLQAVSLQELDLMLNVNVRGVFLAIQAAAAHLSEGGRVITIGSNTAVRSSYPGSSVYAMTWRKRFGGLQASDVKRLRQLEVENGRLKKLVAERDLEIEVMKEVAAKKNGKRAGSPEPPLVTPG